MLIPLKRVLAAMDASARGDLDLTVPGKDQKDEIGGQIAEIQNATGASVDAMKGIGDTITKMNHIAAAIAAAVEQQGAATQEIARNVQQAAAGTGEVSSSISSVTQAADDTGNAANELNEAAASLGTQSAALRQAVDGFLAQVRAG